MDAHDHTLNRPGKQFPCFPGRFRLWSGNYSWNTLNAKKYKSLQKRRGGGGVNGIIVYLTPFPEGNREY
ncbi:hypothetical protein DWW55_16005 [Paraprevotella clara]|nr:hypothetical protein DWW55_16005 [Paraprevotella clara]